MQVVKLSISNPKKEGGELLVVFGVVIQIGGGVGVVVFDIWGISLFEIFPI